MSKTIKKIKIETDVEKHLGQLARELDLLLNPHGFSAKRKIHKSKKQYRRRNKHRQINNY